METFALKGHLLYTRVSSRFECFPDHYIVCENGCVAGIFPHLPERYAGVAVEDCGNCLIVPGLVDLHLYAPQYAFRGLGMDLELLDWLDSHTFPEGSRYADPVYAEKGRFHRALSTVERQFVFRYRAFILPCRMIFRYSDGLAGFLPRFLFNQTNQVCPLSFQGSFENI